MRILVCGGRDFTDFIRVKQTLDDLDAEDRPVTWLIHGAARGADSLAERWALANGTPILRYPANWGKWGRSAGAVRNQQMLDEGKPDLVVAFPGGPGTALMVKLARKAGVEVLQVVP